MRHPTLIAFALVMLLAAPGTYGVLSADGEAAPSPVSLVKVGDAKLAVSLEHARVKPGESIMVAMSMENPGPRERVTEVEIALLERESMPMARVAPPPRARHTEQVTMVAKAKGTTKQTVALKVPAPRGKAPTGGRVFVVRVTAKGGVNAASIAVVALPPDRAAPTRTARTDRPALAASNATRPTL